MRSMKSDEKIQMKVSLLYGAILLLAPAAGMTSAGAATDANLVDIAAQLEPIRQEYDFPALAAAVIPDGRLHALGVAPGSAIRDWSRGSTISK